MDTGESRITGAGAEASGLEHDRPVSALATAVEKVRDPRLGRARLNPRDGAGRAHQQLVEAIAVEVPHAAETLAGEVSRRGAEEGRVGLVQA